MCLAGEGGGKGSLRSRLAGVVGAEPAGAGDLRGDAAVPPKRWCAGLGLGVENGKNGDTAQCFFPVAGVAGVALPGGGVAGAACGGEPSASCVSGFAWHPPMSRAGRRGGWRAASGIWEALRGELAGGHGARKGGSPGRGREREKRELWGARREWRVGTAGSEAN